jgi:hypothetical protein
MERDVGGWGGRRWKEVGKAGTKEGKWIKGEVGGGSRRIFTVSCMLIIAAHIIAGETYQMI